MIALFCLASALTLALGQAQAVELLDPLDLGARDVPKGEAIDLTLPALPARDGHLTALRFRAVIMSEGKAGCNYNASVAVNGTALTRYSAGGDERLLGRLPGLELAAGNYAGFPVFNGDRLMMMFAPDVDTGDTMATDGAGASFLLDVSDLARGVDGNTLSFRNLLPGEPKPGFGNLRIEGLAVGYVHRASLPEPKTAVPERGAVERSVSAGGLTLAQSARGGLVVSAGDQELLIETGLGLDRDAASVLIADDGAPAPADVEVAVEPWGALGFRTTAVWPAITLTRTVAVAEGVVDWRERWTNASEEIRGVPFRHRVFLRKPASRFYLGGSADNLALAGSASNPTIFLEGPGRSGNGVGITGESDWLRLLMGLRCGAGVGEIFSETLALAPGKSIDFRLAISPVTDGGGYWSFINGVRARWGVNGVTQERAVFWGYARADVDDSDERARASLAHLGPIYLVIGPWQRLEPDAKAVRAGAYPKLPEGAPPTPGACPDLDVDAFVTFAHRERYWEQLKIDVDRIRRAASDVKVMQMLHPAMEAVYRPLRDRWPIASEAILMPNGRVFEVAHYSRAWLGQCAEKDWGVLYYVPRPGSVYLDQIMSGVRRALDEVGLDGIYCDEFSWAGRSRGYSRYDYGRWDGYSADLGDDGDVLRLKSDNGFVSESCQLRMVNEVLRRGLYFLGNGGNALSSLNRLPHARFIEGGNGAGAWPQGHLSPTPLVLGNMGDQKSRRGVFESVKTCLAHGCIYSPSAVNLLLEGPNNFVCKQYPLAVTRLGPGYVVGRERLITTVSRTFDWPPAPSTVMLYRYNAEGELLDREAPSTVDAVGDLAVEVPDAGLVIAEIAGP